MTLTLPTYADIHRVDPELRFVWLVAIGGTLSTTPLYMTDGMDPVVYGSETYQPDRSITVDGLGSAPEGAISIGNGDGEMGARAALWKAIDARPSITITELWLDATGAQQGSYVILYGYLQSPSWDNQIFHASITGESVLSSQAALAWGYDTACTYRAFKGPECGYAGAEVTCDRTLTRCTALGNSARFGGFSGIHAVGSTQDLWYRTYTFRLRPESV